MYPEAISSVRALEKSIEETKIKLEQPNRIFFLKEDVKLAVESLKILEGLDRTNRLTDLEKGMVYFNLATVMDLSDKVELNVMETQRLQQALVNIRAPAVRARCDIGVETPVTFVARNGSETVDNAFEIVYVLASESTGDARTFLGGQLARASGRLRPGLYRFWTQDPLVSTRKGEARIDEICGENEVTIYLPVPRP